MSTRPRQRNALQQIFAPSELNIVWDLERRRLKSSCFGIDRVSGAQFDAERAWRIPSLRSRRLASNFTPQPLLAIARPKPSGGFRIICIPTIEDRLIQFSILYRIKDSLKKRGLLNDVSYGLVAGAQRTVQDARKKASLLRDGANWVYKADIEKFFDRVPRDYLERQIRSAIDCRSLHGILISFASVEIGDGFSPNWSDLIAKSGIVKGVGVRQGMPLSPYFAGIVLRDLDKSIIKKRFRAIRYVDDIIGFFKSRRECEEFDSFLREELGKIGLSIGLVDEASSKTKIFAPDEAAEFLGMEMRFGQNGKCSLWIGEKTLVRIEERFTEMMSLDVLIKEGVTLPMLGSRLEAMRRGYIAAYGGAENMEELKGRIRNISDPIVHTVLEEIFGIQMRSLNKKQRRFLGI